MSKSYKQLEIFHENHNKLKERVKQFGYETLLDEEILHSLTLIPVEKLRGQITKYGLQDMVKFSDTYNLTLTQKNKLKMVFEFSKRLNRTPFKEKVKLDSSSIACKYFLNELRFLNIENFLVAFLDNQNRLIGLERASSGSTNETGVYVKEIVKSCVVKSSCAVVVAHNHPSGSLQPSKSDIETTKRLKEALHLVDIKLIDHIIVAEDQAFSFAEHGMI